MGMRREDIDYLRGAVAYFDGMDEHFLDRFDVDELLAIWRYATEHNESYGADKWDAATLAEALRPVGAKLRRTKKRRAVLARTLRGFHRLYRYKEARPEDFGHYMAMEALGHGVAWGDDHPDHGFLIPSAEFHCYEESGCEGYVSDREGLASRG